MTILGGDNMEFIYFELNNWFCGRDYPDAEPFVSWMANDLKQKFRDEDWVKENKLVVVESFVDMSLNYCITATKEWVQINFPELLTKFTQFIRSGEEHDDLPEGRFGCPFLEYSEDNIGCHYAEEKEDDCGYLYYSID